MTGFRQCQMRVFDSTGLHPCAAEAVRQVTYSEERSVEEGGGTEVQVTEVCDRHAAFISDAYEVLKDMPYRPVQYDAAGDNAWVEMEEGQR